MFFHTLAFILLFSATAVFAQGRSPAVEDFVGIEVEESQVAPQGTESLYNLEQDLNRISEQKERPVNNTPSTISQSNVWGVAHIFAVAFILGLPTFIWLMMMNHLKRKASAESASNIEVLEKYRKEREKKLEEKSRKAS